MIIDAEITVDLLELAPEGSWLVEEYADLKSIFDRSEQGRWVRRGGHPYGHSAQTMVDLSCGGQTLHHPGLIRVLGKNLAEGVTVWEWHCQLEGCGDKSVFHIDSGFIHDSARAHLDNHAELINEPTVCDRCDATFPHGYLAVHLVADHGVLQ